MLYLRFLDVIAVPSLRNEATRNLIYIRNTLSLRRLRMFHRNDGKARGTHSWSRVTEDYQKTKGFNRKAEKYTSLSLAEKKWGIFRTV